MLSINGVKPSLTTVLNGQYPLARELYMFTRPNAPPLALAFTALFSSPAGRALVEEEGFIAVEAKP